MPVANTVSASSSESEKEVVAPKEPVGSRRKRRRTKSPAPKLDQKSAEQSLRALLGHQCSCKKGSCLQQFGADFDALLDYRKQWFDLHKLDQDSFDSPWSSVIFS